VHGSLCNMEMQVYASMWHMEMQETDVGESRGRPLPSISALSRECFARAYGREHMAQNTSGTDSYGRVHMA
jgi:hypothetical protein